MHSHEQGNILLSSLLILLIMNLLGVGLVQASMKESRTATLKSIESEVFHVTDSCVRDAITWMKTQERPSDVMPYTITQENLDFLLIGDEEESVLNKMAGYSYSCTVTDLASKSMNDDEGAGQEIGQASGYGGSGDTTPRYFYRIDATGQGPQNAVKTIESIISVTF